MSQEIDSTSSSDASLAALVKNLLDTSAECDVIFVSAQKQHIKAHKMILSLFSKFFKDLFTQSPIEERLLMSPQFIILPSYSTIVIEAFVQFFYTGEALIPENSLNEFILLCKDLNCDEIPSLQNILQMRAEETVKQEETKNFIAVTSTEPIVNDESETVESIYFQIETNPIDEAASIDEMETSLVKEEYLNEEYIEENPQYEYIEIVDKNPQHPLEQSTNRNHSSLAKPRGVTKNQKPKFTIPRKVLDIKKLQEDTERYKRNLQEAVNAVRDNIDTLEEASEKFKVPVSAIERNLKNYKSAW